MFRQAVCPGRQAAPLPTLVGRPSASPQASVHLPCLAAHARALLGTQPCPPPSLTAQDPEGSLARLSLQAVLHQAGRQLGSPHSWQQRELRNPLMDAALPPSLALAPHAALGAQSLANLARHAALGGRRPVAGVMLLYGPHLLWSSLPPRDTAAVFALLATGLLHASSKSSSGGSGGAGAAGQGSSGSANVAAGGVALSDLRPLDGGAWQQLPSGFLVQRGSGSGSGGGGTDGPADAPAISVPVVHLQQRPADQQPQHAQQAGAEGQPAAGSGSSGNSQAGALELHPHHLLPLLEGKLLMALLLGGGTRLLTPPLLAGLHALLAAPAKQLAAQVGSVGQCWLWMVCIERPSPAGMAARACITACAARVLPPPSPPRSAPACPPQIGEDLRASRVEAAHLPGFRYLYQDEGQQVVRASPRAKVSAMSHHARALAAAVRDSLKPLPGGASSGAAAGGAGAGSGGAGLEAAPLAEGAAQPGDHEILEVLAKSSQECWAAAWRPGDGRQLLAVRERRSEREPAEAAEVMQAFASSHFYM